MSQQESRLGGHILVDQLVAQGVKHVFCVPGESYLAVLDGLHDADIKVTVCRQEGGAAMMADAHGKLTGEPGICMVTRGPGASNALAGVHIAKQDSTPLILFVGQIERGMREREAFQEMDYRAVFGTQAKWVTEIDQVERIPELVSRAFHIATSGRPGPVVIALPEDMLVEAAKVADAPRYEVIDSAPTAGQLADLEKLLAEAKNPVAILGGTRWDARAVQQFADFAQRHALPTAVSFRRQMLFPADHPCFIGDVGLGINPALLKRVADADLILLVGGRMSENPSQAYTLLDIPVPKQKLVHVHPDTAELGRVYRPTLAINTSPAAFAQALGGLKAPAQPAWAAGTQAMRESYLKWSDPSAITTPGALQMGQVMAYLEKTLPADAIMTNGAGNYATWLHRFHRFTRYGTQLAPTSGSMGYGLPAAVGAKRVSPRQDRGLLRWRRLLPDARPGIRDRGAIRPAHRRGAGGQRHVRHDPHAPGKALPRPHFRDRAEESGLRRLRARLRRARRTRRDHRTIRSGLRTRPGQRQAGHPALLHRSGNHHPGHDPGKDPRRSAQGAALKAGRNGGAARRPFHSPLAARIILGLNFLAFRNP